MKKETLKQVNRESRLVGEQESRCDEKTGRVTGGVYHAAQNINKGCNEIEKNNGLTHCS